MNTINKFGKKLYFKGNLSLLDRKCISIVGSRSISLYTKNLVARLSRGLVDAGFVVVSGGAIGTDIVANENALPNTIAVFANSLDEIYPKSNEGVIKKIYSDALALSEYDEVGKIQKYKFLKRNEIVVLLGEVLIVASASLKSGSMNSIKIAQKLNKEIFVLPQRIGESDGTNFLLANSKAKLIYDIDEFINSLSSRFSLNFKREKQVDEVLDFISKNSNLKDAYQKFGNLIDEYELDKKVIIKGVEIFINQGDL